jgi:hypothetical protein
MPSHWTYDSFEPSDHLRQGDLLRRTGELLSVLSQVHNFFAMNGICCLRFLRRPVTWFGAADDVKPSIFNSL